MPIFEYQCDACGRRIEKIQKASDPPVETCPHCGGHLHKLQSAPAIQFKGSGWYVTDYARKDSGGGAKGGESTDKPSAKETTSAEKDSAPKKTEPSSTDTTKS